MQVIELQLAVQPAHHDALRCYILDIACKGLTYMLNMQHAKAQFQGGQEAMSTLEEAIQTPHRASAGVASGVASPEASSSTPDKEDSYGDPLDLLDDLELQLPKTLNPAGRRGKGKRR